MGGATVSVTKIALAGCSGGRVVYVYNNICIVVYKGVAFAEGS